MKVMPIGGKATNNTVQGISVTNDGAVNTEKVWEQNFVKLMDYEEIRDTNAHTTIDTVCNCAAYAMTSLRVSNSLGINVAVVFYYDFNSTSTDYLNDFNGNAVSFIARPGMTIITPDDIPTLKYVNYLKLRVQAESAPTTGGLSILAYQKR